MSIQHNKDKQSRQSLHLFSDNFSIPFRASIAAQYGLNEILMTFAVSELLFAETFDGERLHKKKGPDGRTWVAIPPRIWHDALPFFSDRTRKRTLARCREIRLLKTERLNAARGDQTNYYCLDLFDPIQEGGE